LLELRTQRNHGQASEGRHTVSYEQIWAPWRLAYIKQTSPDGSEAPSALRFLAGADPACFLCQSVADPDDCQRHVVHQSAHALTVLNRYPYNNGHLLVAPKRHCGRLDQLTGEEHGGIMHDLTRMVSLLEIVLRPDGFNVGLNLGSAAGAGLPSHLHWHIVPRWRGDTNFMTTLAAVRVIPQSLDDLHQALIEALGQGL
jgi:ATP adenylyltransferase